jgi:hypothetical protein
VSQVDVHTSATSIAKQTQVTPILTRIKAAVQVQERKLSKMQLQLPDPITQELTRQLRQQTLLHSTGHTFLTSVVQLQLLTVSTNCKVQRCH